MRAYDCLSISPAPHMPLSEMRAYYFQTFRAGHRRSGVAASIDEEDKLSILPGRI